MNDIRDKHIWHIDSFLVADYKYMSKQTRVMYKIQIRLNHGDASCFNFGHIYLYFIMFWSFSSLFHFAINTIHFCHRPRDHTIVKHLLEQCMLASTTLWTIPCVETNKTQSTDFTSQKPEHLEHYIRACVLRECNETALEINEAQTLACAITCSKLLYVWSAREMYTIKHLN